MKRKRTSYQNGSVSRKPRANGPDVWVFRYTDRDGVKRSETLGSVDEFKTRAAARKQADKKRVEVNERMAGVVVSGLCDYFQSYLDETKDIRPHSIATYASFLKRVRADWGDRRVDDMARDIPGVEEWLNNLETMATPDIVVPDRMAKGKLIPGYVKPGKPARPASKKTRLHMKAFVHLVFESAMKWNLLPVQRNPATLLKIRGRKKKVRPPNIITKEQWVALITETGLAMHVRTMLFIAMLLGLRASEILGLQWEDVTIDRKGNPVLRIQRSQVGQHTGETKTEGSEEEMPLHDDLTTVIDAWRAEVKGESEEDPTGWMFVNMVTERPFWRGTLQKRHLTPAGKKIGIPNLGWHDFRHTYRAMMDELKISLEEQRTLMRHEDIRTTLGYGGKSKAETGRAANARVVEMLRKPA